MKKAITLSIGIFLISFSTLIASTDSQTDMYHPNFVNYGNSYIFTVQNVEFSVFPDGQFDFTYIGNYNNTNVTVSSPNVNISYNSGYNYEMFVQYDGYGGVIQIENVPIYYDEFGRIAQAGDVNIYYNRNRIVRVGGLYINYNRYGYYTHSTGYINSYNFYYAYRPWHVYYARPVYASCVVYDYPYRRNYSPTRYSYNQHSNYYSNRGRDNVSYANGRRSFNKPGSRNHYKGGRSEVNKEYKPNRRNTAVAGTSRGGNANNDSYSRKSKKRSNINTSNSSTRPTENSRPIAKTRPVTNTKPVASSQSHRGNSFVSNSNTRPTNTSNQGSRGNRNSVSNTKKVSYKTNTSTQNRKSSYSGSKTTKIAANTKRSTKENSNTNTSRRGRGL